MGARVRACVCMRKQRHKHATLVLDRANTAGKEVQWHVLSRWAYLTGVALSILPQHLTTRNIYKHVARSALFSREHLVEVNIFLAFLRHSAYYH